MLYENLPRPNKCLIYCRVSSQKQVTEGHGLDSQEKRCRDYATSKNYEVVKVFVERGVTGGQLDRPAMRELLDYLGSVPKTDKHVVVFDDIKRFARDPEIHFALKRAIVNRGHTIESPNFTFGSSPHDKFIETVFAATAALERDENARQVKQKMTARMEIGYWCLRSPPLGLTYKRDPVHGKVLDLVEPIASILKEAVESYDRGLLNTLEEVRTFIENEYKRHNINRTPSISGVKEMLSELLYTGYMEYKPWGINRMKGHHAGFISLDTYIRVQEKLKGKAKPHRRKDFNPDFPLRPWVQCDFCWKGLTAAWVKGRSSLYPKYWCRNRQCSAFSASVIREVIEKEFISILEQSKPSGEVIDLMKDVLLNSWENKATSFKEEFQRTARKINDLEQQKTNFSEQLGKKIAENDQELIKIYEDQVKKLSKEIDMLRANLGKPKYTKDQFRTASDQVFNILKEPVAMWESKEYQDKITILGMYFSENLRYSIKEGFRTASLALPVALLKDIDAQESLLVEMSGIEPESNKAFL